MLNQENIDKLRQLEILRKRESRFAYYGILQEYQLNIDNFEKLNYNKLNSYQHFLFKRVLHGLNVYTKDEIAKLHKEKKKRIIRVWKKAQNVINEWKQTIASKQVNYYLSVTFGDKANAITSIPDDEVLPEYINTLKLKDLGIRYEDVILKFMSEGLLPKNFLTLDDLQQSSQKVSNRTPNVSS